MSTFSRISSLMVPVNARFKATSSLSNFGHSTPGVSNNSILSLMRIHCFCLVTPGLFPTPAVVLFEIRLIKDDFPTFGIPKYHGSYFSSDSSFISLRL